ncbi:MAG: hypothetical protein M1448_03960 [Candidatus Marsarchaeota archaeon]|jgi:histone H3/H4|nr:hypothetical protein [Candidatus Marsarchaeota archaeon]
MTKQKGFSSYDIIEFFKEVGAGKVNEKAVDSLKRELEETVEDLVHDAQFYANYAGRSSLIRNSDVKLANANHGRMRIPQKPLAKKRLRKSVSLRTDH